VVVRIGLELDHTMDRLFPEQLGGDAYEPSNMPDYHNDAQPFSVSAEKDGYLQIVDSETLMSFASDTDTVLTLVRRPGDYVVQGMPLLHAVSSNRLPKDMQQRLQGAFVLGNQRTAAQDVEFVILQLVEIATRALSPGINDPFTAIACIDRVSSAFCRLAQRRFPKPCRYDEAQRLRIITTPHTFPGLVDAAFNPLRNYARSSVEVTVRLLESLAVIGSVVTRLSDRTSIERHADIIMRSASKAMLEEADRQAVANRYHAVRQALGTQLGGANVFR
jgi:uncharacterized membrane protein